MEITRDYSKISIDYFKKFKTSSGLNNRLTKKEIECLIKDNNSKKISEAVHILVYGYVGICKICQKRTEYIDISKLYRKFCSHKCSTLDHESHYLAAKKSSITKKKNNKKVVIPKVSINCKECHVEMLISINARNRHKQFCDIHKKKCPNCNSRHNNSGRCCSMKCTNSIKMETNIKNSNVTHNLLKDGARKNQIDFYLKRGFAYEESNKMLLDFQKESNKMSNSIESKLKSILSKNKISIIDDYFSIYLKDKIANFGFKELYKPYDLIKANCNDAVIEKFGIKKIYDILYKMDSNLFRYKRIKFIRGRYGYNSYTKNNVLLRSKMEYDFYQLLETNGIKNYKIGGLYPDSKLRYDFYLYDYSIYIEIAGMMSLPSYFEKMKMKKEKFKNVEIIQNYNEMIIFIQKIKSNQKIKYLNENQINSKNKTQ
jgi:endogenous inhibitor of DNA gyrase (YacG/DUF329 family)